MSLALPARLDGAALDRAIVRLALPATAATVLRGMFTFADAWWCGRLGAEGLAAFGAASFWVWALAAASLTASVGVGARVARATGAGDAAGAAEAVRDGLWAAVLLAVGCGIVLGVGAPQLLAFQGAEASVAAAGAGYLRAVALGTPALFLYDTLDAALRGSGDTRTAAKIGIGSLVLNFLLDPLLVFGAGPLPAMGVAGVGIATAFIQLCAAGVMAGVLHRRGRLVVGRADFSGLGATVRIGAPSALLGVGFALVYVAITPAVAQFGTAPLAALAIGHRLESFAFMVNSGFAAAAQALVGQRLGAGDPEGARQAARRITLQAATITGLFSVALFAAAPSAAQLFGSDPAVLDAATSYLRIVAICIAPQTVEMVLTGAFEGAGNTLPPLLVGIAAHGARLPLVYLCVRGLGLPVASVWSVIALCSIAAGALLLVLFRRARWS